MANADNGLGPWADADLAKTARMDAGVGVDEGLPSKVRFVSNVAKLIRRRGAQPDAGGDPTRPAIFLLQPSPRQLELGAEPKREPMLNNAQTPVNGRIWFVSAVVVSGRYIDFEATDDDAMFTLITDDMGKGAVPTIIFDPRLPMPEARYYPSGLDEPELCEIISVTSTDVTLDRVLEAIEGTYKDDMITPEQQTKPGKLWHNQGKWWPKRDAEDLIQMYLKIGLNRAFRTCDVRHEKVIAEGRLDLIIEERHPIDREIVTNHAVLELKVLRSYGEGGANYTEEYNLDWIKKGVKQAFSYRKGKGAKWSALCCFDMRKSDTGEACFEHVRDMAKGLKVHLKRWFLYAKSEYLRDALASSG